MQRFTKLMTEEGMDEVFRRYKLIKKTDVPLIWDETLYEDWELSQFNTVVQSKGKINYDYVESLKELEILSRVIIFRYLDKGQFILFGDEIVQYCSLSSIEPIGVAILFSNGKAIERWKRQ